MFKIAMHLEIIYLFVCMVQGRFSIGSVNVYIYIHFPPMGIQLSQQIDLKMQSIKKMQSLFTVL